METAWLRVGTAADLVARVDAEDAAAQAAMPRGRYTRAWWQGWSLDPKTLEACAPGRYQYYRVDLERFTTPQSTLHWLTHLSHKHDEFKVQGLVRLLNDVLGYDWFNDKEPWTKKRLRERLGDNEITKHLKRLGCKPGLQRGGTGPACGSASA